MSQARGVALQPDPASELAATSPAWCGHFAGVTSSRSSAANGEFAQTIAAFLGHREAASRHLDRTLALDPNHVIARVLRGFSLRTLGRRDLFPQVEDELSRAREVLDGHVATARERHLVAALEAVLVGDRAETLRRLAEALRADPTDLLVLKLDHSLRFMAGDLPGMLESLQRCLPAFSADHPGRPYVLGCLAFAYEELHDVRQAERLGREAVESQPLDLWAAHAVAHVMLAGGRADEGVEWIHSFDQVLKGGNNFAGHVAWHEALFHLSGDRPRRALDLYDRKISTYPPRDYRDISNASTLLYRLERRGLDVGTRWCTLADVAISRKGDHVSAFADVHYVLSLCGVGDVSAARAFVSTMKRCNDAGVTNHDARVGREVGVPAVEAIIDLYDGNAAKGRAEITRLGPRLHELGGSHAQRAIFEWLVETDSPALSGVPNAADDSTSASPDPHSGTSSAWPSS